MRNKDYYMHPLLFANKKNPYLSIGEKIIKILI